MTLEVKEAPETAEVVRDIKDTVRAIQQKSDKAYNDLAETTKLLEERKAGKEDVVDIKDLIAGITDEIKTLLPRVEAAEEALRAAGRPGARAEAAKSLEDLIGESKQLEAMRARVARGAKLEIGNAKSVTSAANSAGALVVEDRRPGIIEKPLRPLSIRDLLPSRATTSDSLTIVKELLFTNSAAPVAEEASKPYSDITFEDDTVAVRTIAHLLKASNQIIADAPGLASFIDGRLRDGYRIVEENQLLTGDGTGQNLTGLIPNATAFSATGIPGGNAATQIDRLRWAKLQVRKSFYAADTIVLNPQDWAAIELLKDDNKLYQFASFLSGAQARLWGMTVVESDAIAVGHFLCGNFSLAAEIADREGLNVAISSENQDDFERNRVTMRAEGRLALQIFRPQAYVYGTLLHA